jgi:hypothetical protein
VALTILALRDLSSGVIDEQCSAENILSMSQQDPVKQQVSRFSTGWFMQAITGLHKDYLSTLEQTEDFWKAAELSMDDLSMSGDSRGGSKPKATLGRDVKAGELFIDFRGHWIPQGVKSPVEDKIKQWQPTRLLLATEGPLKASMKATHLDFVSSVPQIFDFVERTVLLQDANLCMFPYEDKEIGHVVFKSQFIKDIKKDEEIRWWVPSIQAQGRAVNLPMNMDTIKDPERQRFLLETSFRTRHGESIQTMHQEALRRMEQPYVEHYFDDKILQDHLGNMFQQMQQDQDKLSSTTIFMKRLRFFPPSPEEIAAGEPPLPQQQVKKKSSHHQNYHHISYHYHYSIRIIIIILYHHQIIRIYFILDRSHGERRMESWW